MMGGISILSFLAVVFLASKTALCATSATKASSVYQNNVRNWGPQLAMKGNSKTSTGYFHSKAEKSPWLTVQIPDSVLGSVIVINRKDCCGSRLKNLEVKAGMKGGHKAVATFKGPGKTGGEARITFKHPVRANLLSFQLKPSAYRNKIRKKRCLKSRFTGRTYCHHYWLYYGPTKYHNQYLQINGIRLEKFRTWASSVYPNTRGKGDINKWGSQLALEGTTKRISTGYFHSKLQHKPWLLVRLPEAYGLLSVTVINRKDCCGKRLINLQVRAGMSHSLHNKVVGFFKGPGRIGGHHKIRFVHGVNAGYISFQIVAPGSHYLQINGLRFGRFETSASSVYPDGPGKGNINKWGPQLAMPGGAHKDTGYFHSKAEHRPWLRVEIPLQRLRGITVINRKDCCGERLKNLEIRAGMRRSLHNRLVARLSQGKTGGSYTFHFRRPVTAKYISFQIVAPGKHYLQINGIRLL